MKKPAKCESARVKRVPYRIAWQCLTEHFLWRQNNKGRSNRDWWHYDLKRSIVPFVPSLLLEVANKTRSFKELIGERLLGIVTMPRLEQPPPDDFRRVLREKALSHSLFYVKLGTTGHRESKPTTPRATAERSAATASAPARAPQTARLSRQAQPRVSELLRRFEPSPMQYLRPPRAPSTEDITSSDDDDRAAVRRRSRDLSDDSAIELEPRRRHSHPRDVTPPPEAASGRRERTLVEAHVVELGARRGSEGCTGRPRCVRTPSVVVSDYSEGVVGASPEEAAWLRARSLSADSACSSCSTLSSRDDEEYEAPLSPIKKIVNVD